MNSTGNSTSRNIIKIIQDERIAGGGLPFTQAEKDYVHTIVQGMMNIGTWDLCKAVYLMVGGTAAAHKWNTKDMRDLDAAFRLVFTNSPTQDTNGVLFNGTNQYANTFFNPTTMLSNPKTNLSQSFYITGGNGGGSANNYTMGACGNNNSDFGSYETAISSRATIKVAVTAGESFSGNFVSATSTYSNGYVLGSTKSGSLKLFNKGTLLSSTTPSVSGFPANNNIFLGTRSENTSTAGPYYQNVRLGLITIGDGFTDQQVDQQSQLAYYCQGILGRQ